MIKLQRTDASRNMARFYCLSVQPDLFGTGTLETEWGVLARRAPCARALMPTKQQPMPS